jgi:muconolactone delta-isomerase
MKYLVTMEATVTPPASPQGRSQHMEKVFSFHEALVKMEAEKKILAGGDLTGRPDQALIVEAASNVELPQLLLTLPVAGMCKVEITPLDSFEERLALAHQVHK